MTNTQYEENTMHRVMITDHVCHVIVPFVLLHSIVVALVQSAHGLSRLLPHGVLVRTTALLDPPGLHEFSRIFFVLKCWRLFENYVLRK